MAKSGRKRKSSNHWLPQVPAAAWTELGQAEARKQKFNQGLCECRRLRCGCSKRLLHVLGHRARLCSFLSIGKSVQYFIIKGQLWHDQCYYKYWPVMYFKISHILQLCKNEQLKFYEGKDQQIKYYR